MVLFRMFISVSIVVNIPLSLSIGLHRLFRSAPESHVCRCGEWNDELESRIVGGVKMNPHRYPWLAVLLKNRRFHCGGSIINSQYVLTAGHCVFDDDSRQMLPPETFIAVLGVYDRENEKESSRKYHNVDDIKVPALFHGDPLHDIHDVALLKLDRKVQYSSAIKPVCLPTSRTFKYVGKYGIISGWGTLSFKGPLSQYPLEAAVRVISNEKCMPTRIVGSHFAENTKAMFCAYNVNTDACQGDSGGPMIIQDGTKITQIGIISWGIECALKDHPGVYTRLTYYLDWIHKNTQDATYCDG